MVDLPRGVPYIHLLKILKAEVDVLRGLIIIPPKSGGDIMGKQEYISEIERAVQILDRISQDRGVPKNIRRAATEAIDALRDESQSYGVRASKAISILNDIINDINMPFPTRSQILLTVGILERIRD